MEQKYVVNLVLPMEVRKVIADDKVHENVGKLALERGPLVYCFEHADNNGNVMNIIIPDHTSATATFNANLLGGVTTIQCDAAVVRPSADGSSVETVKEKVTAIPYFTWANRGEGQMQVWVPY